MNGTEPKARPYRHIQINCWVPADKEILRSRTWELRKESVDRRWGEESAPS